MILLFWGGRILLAVVIIRASSEGASRSNKAEAPGDKTALQILEERYAKGEVSREEFETIRAEIID